MNDPLLRAIWSLLPSEGGFPAARRAKWIESMALACDLVYGDAGVVIKARPVADLSRGDARE